MTRSPQGRIGTKITVNSAPKPEEKRVFKKLPAYCAFQGEEGQDLVEYALLLGFVALAGTAIYTALSNNISALWTAIATRLASTN